MAVHTIGGGGGFLGSLAKIASLGAAFVPGMQPWAAAIGAASSLANGDPAGAVTNAAGLINQGAKTGAAPAITETGNPRGGVSAVSGGYAPNQPNVSLANTFANILRNPSLEAGRMGSTSPGDRLTQWQRLYNSMNQRLY